MHSCLVVCRRLFLFCFTFSHNYVSSARLCAPARRGSIQFMRPDHKTRGRLAAVFAGRLAAPASVMLSCIDTKSAHKCIFNALLIRTLLWILFITGTSCPFKIYIENDRAACWFKKRFGLVRVILIWSILYNICR